MNARKVTIVAVAWIIGHAHAHSAEALPDPEDPKAKVPQVQYRSAFADYRAIGNEKVSEWKAANDNVGRIGGWKVYAREAQQETPARPPSDASPGSPSRKPAVPAAPARQPHH